MKQLLLSAAAMLIAFVPFAATHVVQVSNFQFSPATLTGVQVGDTVTWTWTNGSHTTTSTSVPAGAAAWDAPITSAATTFSYKVTQAGTYSYVCQPHAPNMAGSFTATGGSTGVAAVGGESPLRLFPNPASATLTIELADVHGQVSVAISDLSGRILSVRDFENGSAVKIATGDLPNGIYTLRAVTGGQTYIGTFSIVQ